MIQIAGGVDPTMLSKDVVTRLIQLYNDLNANFTGIKAATETRLNNFRDELSALEQLAQNIATGKQGMEGELRRDIEDLTRAIAGTRDELQNQITAGSANTGTLAERIKSLEQASATVLQRLQGVDSLTGSHGTRLEGLEAGLENLAGTISNLGLDKLQSLAEINARINQVNQTISRLELDKLQSLANVNQALGALQDTVNNLQLDRLDLIENLRRDISILDNAFADFRRNVSAHIGNGSITDQLIGERSAQDATLPTGLISLTLTGHIDRIATAIRTMARDTEALVRFRDNPAEHIMANTITDEMIGRRRFSSAAVEGAPEDGTMNTFFTDAISELSRAIGNLRGRLNTVNEEVRLAMGGLADRVTTLEAGDDKNRADILKLISAVDEMTRIMDETDWQELAGRVGSVEEALDSAVSQIAVLEANDTENRNAIAELSDKTASLDGKMAEARSGMARLQDDIDAMDGRFTERLANIDGQIDDLNEGVGSIKGDIQSVRGEIERETRRLDSRIGGLVTDIENESAERQATVGKLAAAIESEVATRQIQVVELGTAIENEAANRSRQITEAITAEAMARERQAEELNTAMTNGLADLGEDLAHTNQVLSGVGAVSLHGAFLTRELGGMTEVPISLFGSFTNFQAGKTIVFDESGTVGVYTGNADSATINILTKSISHVSGDQPTMLGSVETHADLPITTVDAESLFMRTPRINDYVHVKSDETRDNHRVLWYIVRLGGGEIGWGNPFILARDDFQSMTGAVDSGRVLTGGATPGTFGESINIDTTVTRGSNNLITSDAVASRIENIMAGLESFTDLTVTNSLTLGSGPNAVTLRVV